MKKNRIELAGAGMMLNALDLPMVLRRPFMIIWKMGCGAEMPLTERPVSTYLMCCMGCAACFGWGWIGCLYANPFFRALLGLPTESMPAQPLLGDISVQQGKRFPCFEITSCYKNKRGVLSPAYPSRSAKGATKPIAP